MSEMSETSDDVLRERELAEKEFQIWLGQQGELVRELPLSEQREMWMAHRYVDLQRTIARIAGKMGKALKGEN